MPLWRFVTFTQDHDQIGNRATGDRLSATLDERGLGLQAVLCLLSPFTPMLFMGEEWGASTPWQFFTSHPEPELGRVTAEGRILEFEKMGWDPEVVPDPQDPETFQRSKLRWDEKDDGMHARLLELHRNLIRLRKNSAALGDPRFGTVHCAYDEDARWFRLDREGLSVVLNFAEEERSVPLEGASGILLSTAALGEDARLEDAAVRLPARTAAVVARNP
jgi:maltooligosyltrehalose trehalohydrolase